MGSSPNVYRFREFELDLRAYQLRRGGRAVRLERRVMDLLVLLVEHPDALVTRDQIVERLWGPNVFVDVETGVNTAVSKLRQALREPADTPICIETVLGRGYRFIAPIDIIPPPVAVSHPAEPSVVPPTTLGLPVPSAPAAARSARRSRVTRLAGGAIVLLASGLGVWLWAHYPAPASRTTVAVLPFENLTGDPDRGYLASGLTDETAAAMSQFDPTRVGVIGRTATRAYGGSAKSPREIAAELGADYVVAGSVRAEGDRVRVTASLVRGRDQVQVWSSTYDRAPTSVLELQRELSAAIATEVGGHANPERAAALSRRYAIKPEAYDLYLRGRTLANQLTPATTRRAIEYYERAVTIDPAYGLLWAGLADAISASPINGDASPAEVRPRARDAAQRAVTLAPDLAEGYTALGTVLFMLDFDWPAAETAYRKALALDPSYALAHRMLGHLLSQTGRHLAAREAVERAVALDPLYAMNRVIQAQVAFQARDYSDALKLARLAIAADSDFWVGYMLQAQALERLGLYDEALASLAIAEQLSRGNSKPLSLRGYILARRGQIDPARAQLAELTTRARSRYVPPYAFALIHAGLDEREQMFARLHDAATAGDVHQMFLTVDEKWDPFRNDPRFVDLLKPLGVVAKPLGARTRASSAISDEMR